MGSPFRPVAVDSPQRHRERRVPCRGCARGGRGWETGDCDFDAETRRRGDKRREAAQSKRGRARRQRRMGASGEKTFCRGGTEEEEPELGSDWQAEARPTNACPRGGRGWETGDCDFDAETRRRGDKRREAAQSKRGRARRQRRMVASGEKTF